MFIFLLIFIWSFTSALTADNFNVRAFILYSWRNKIIAAASAADDDDDDDDADRQTFQCEQLYTKHAHSSKWICSAVENQVCAVAKLLMCHQSATFSWKKTETASSKLRRQTDIDRVTAAPLQRRRSSFQSHRHSNQASDDARVHRRPRETASRLNLC